jgi:energy-coupling factor transporter ATP-binding protein EcfA2
MPSSDVTATASLPPKKAIIEQKPTIKSDLASFLREWKYHYETEIIENILLSLKIKKLVILTGNSGSGKTRLARILSEYCSVPILERKRMDIDVRVGKSPENQGWALNRSQVYQQFPELESYTQTYDIEIDGVQGRGKFELTPRLFFENNDDLVRKLSEMRERDPNSRTTLSVMMPSERNGRIEIVAVGANWTDNRHLFGFYNPVTQKYIKTPALDLLLSSNAINMVQSAHFLILDEMNLSHVERYFSDFLSAMEIENGKVNLHSDDESCGIPRSISIRKNLFVFGTVNVDETTYMFSPKVLDRANVVEMPIIPPEEYLLGSLETKEFSGDVEFLSDPLDDSGYGHGGIEQVKSAFSRISGGESGNLWETISRELQNIQDALEGSSFEMGIRTLNEIIGFMYVAWRYERSPGDFKNWKRYLDAQINQKILPKIHGSNKEISDLLKSLYQACLKQEFQDKVASYLVAEGTEIEAISRFPRSAKKISSMYDIVQSAKYVSYTR